MAANRKMVTASGQSIPEWKIVQPNMKPVLINGQLKDYRRLLWEAQYFVHYEVADAQLADSFVKYVEKTFGKKDAVLLRKLPDWKFNPIGKFTYIMMKGVGLQQHHLDTIEAKYKALVSQAAKTENAKAESISKTVKVVRTSVPTIQQRMQEQVLPVCDEIDEQLTNVTAKNITVKQFDPHSILTKSGVIKAPQAKLIKDLYQREYEEAQAVVDWVDEQIKEGYRHMNVNMRRDFLQFYDKLNSACDAIINTGKATRKTRKKKVPSKDKLVARLKYKESDPNIGAASVNPLSIIGASTLWIFNTKNRKLGVYVADQLQKSLSVRGTCIVGFDPAKSTQKTVRKTDMLRGSDKLPRTKMQKLYDEIKTTETVMNGRLNEHVILLRVF